MIGLEPEQFWPMTVWELSWIMLEHGEHQDEQARLRNNTLAHTMWAALAPHSKGISVKKILKQLN